MDFSTCAPYLRDIVFLRIRKMRCALAGFALKSRSDRARLSLERDRSFATLAFSYLCSVRRDVPSDWPVSQGDSRERERQRYPFPPIPPRRREAARLVRIWSTFLHSVCAINDKRRSARDLMWRLSRWDRERVRVEKGWMLDIFPRVRVSIWMKELSRCCQSRFPTNQKRRPPRPSFRGVSGESCLYLT